MDDINKKQENELNEWIESGDFDQVFVDKNPTGRMDRMFYAMLDRERKPQRVRRSFTRFLRLALPIGLLVLTFYLGKQSAEVTTTVTEKDFATTLLSTEDVNDKISLVSNTKIKNETDQKIIEALLFALSNDESVNVRLACINTLYDYAFLPRVRAGLIQAISSQHSPVVLANLAEAINASGKKLTKEEFMDMIDKNLPPPIKNTIDASIIKI